MVFLNGELFVSSGSIAEEVLLCVLLKLVFCAATLVVTVVLLETLVSFDAAPGDEEEEDADVDDGIRAVVNVLPALFLVVKTFPNTVVVCVYVDTLVVVPQRELVTVQVLIAPGSLVVVV